MQSRAATARSLYDSAGTRRPGLLSRRPEEVKGTKRNCAQAGVPGVAGHATRLVAGNRSTHGAFPSPPRSRQNPLVGTGSTVGSTPRSWMVPAGCSRTVVFAGARRSGWGPIWATLSSAWPCRPRTSPSASSKQSTEAARSPNLSREARGEVEQCGRRQRRHRGVRGRRLPAHQAREGNCGTSSRHDLRTTLGNSSG